MVEHIFKKMLTYECNFNNHKLLSKITTQFFLWDAAAASLFNFNRRFRILRNAFLENKFTTLVSKNQDGDRV